MGTHRIDLKYERPPLHANQRLHWARRATVTREVRQRTVWLVRAAKLGAHEQITVGLEWRPATRRRRDGGENLGPLVKALIDGLVDAGVVPDDTPDHVERRTPLLLPVDRTKPGMWLVVDVP